MAVTWLHGQPLLEQFSEAALADPSVRRLMRRVSAVGDELPTALAPQPTTVTVTTTQGGKIQQRVEFARGGPELPLDPEVLDAKFLYCARHVMTPDHILGAIEQFRGMEEVKDLSGLASILGHRDVFPGFSARTGAWSELPLLRPFSFSPVILAAAGIQSPDYAPTRSWQRRRAGNCGLAPRSLLSAQPPSHIKRALDSRCGENDDGTRWDGGA